MKWDNIFFSILLNDEKCEMKKRKKERTIAKIDIYRLFI